MKAKYYLKTISVLLILAITFVGCSEKEMSSAEKAERKASIKQDIQHHLKDSHDFHLFADKASEEELANGEKDKHYGFSLPVILLDEGVHFFMSSEFEHGEKVVQNGDKFYALDHGKIVHANSLDVHDITRDEEGHASSAPFDISITKSTLTIILMSLLLFFLFSRVAKSYKKSAVPSGFGKFVEPIIIFVRDEIARPNIGEKHYKKYMSYLLTVFFFIWFINLTGLTPLGINVTNNIAVTTALALFTLVLTLFTSKKTYWLHIFWMPGVPWPMKIVLAPIELLGVLIKPFALLIRLYANITAGHIVLMSLIGLLFVFQNWFARGAFMGLTVFLSLIELLVAFLQAYIFTMLTALYFGAACEEHDHEHAH